MSTSNNDKKIPIGQEVANHIYNMIEGQIKTMTQVKRVTKIPSLAVVQVGDDKATNIYIRQKKRACDKFGFGFEHVKFPDDVQMSTLLEKIRDLNTDPEVTGIIVQLPLPPHLTSNSGEEQVLNCVAPEKDVDCFNSVNIAKLYLGTHKFVPATVLGIYHFLKYFEVPTVGQHCVIIGKSNIVGKPLSLLLSREDEMACTTTVCDRYTKNIGDICRQADILIVAAGKHHLIKDPDWVKQGAVVIDVGIHRVPVKRGGESPISTSDSLDGKPKTKIEGDVDFQKIAPKCKLITPVPGGVGPMTVAGLLYNLVLSAS